MRVEHVSPIVHLWRDTIASENRMTFIIYVQSINQGKGHEHKTQIGAVDGIFLCDDSLRFLSGGCPRGCRHTGGYCHQRSGIRRDSFHRVLHMQRNMERRDDLANTADMVTLIELRQCQ